ncbi:MAG: NfeD family protein [Anaerovorax sp.]
MNFELSEPIVWIAIAVIFAIIEAFTLGLTTIWFTVGGVVACIIALLGGSLIFQIAGFLIVSIILLYFTRPLAEKKLKIGHEQNITEAMLGRMGVVTTDIQPFQTGQVKVRGQIWTAVCNEDDQSLLKGTEVRIVRIEGVKLIVAPIEVDVAAQQEKGGK